MKKYVSLLPVMVSILNFTVIDKFQERKAGAEKSAFVSPVSIMGLLNFVALVFTYYSN